ncbi:MAG: O-methyltransferase [Solirubrobacteraceae bacterium]|nr:O-methyltransferase [Solirubrobacteraceae bacterium]
MDTRAAYLDLLKRSLADLLVPETSRAVPHPGGGVTFERVDEDDREPRLVGRDWPDRGTTMIGLARLDNLQRCVEAVLRDGIEGDLIETGVWRGGATILMRAVLAAHEDPHRRVWVADSFSGLPAPDAERYADDEGDEHHLYDYLAVPEAEVRRNFERYGLLDDRVRFLPGWFADTLPTLRDETFAVIRLDGDMYASTWQALEALYPRLAPGGFLIVDDYGAIASCAQAVTDFRERFGITAPIEEIDWTGVCWRKPV